MGINTIRETTAKFNEQSTKEKIFNILNLSVPVLIGIFIFFNPFSHTTAIKEICFYGSVIIILVLICFKKIDFSFKSPLTLPFALFTAWAFIGLFFALYKENSIHDFRAHLLEYLAIYYILVNFFNSRKRLIILSWIIIISAAIFSIGGLTYFYLILGNSIPATRITFQETPMGIIGFATLFAILLSLLHFSREIKLYQKLIILIAIAGMVIITLLTQSRGSLLALVFSLLVLLPKHKKSVFIFSLVIIIALSFLPFKDRLTLNAIQNKFRNSSRINKIWPTHFKIIKDYPISGIGFGMDEMSCHQDFWDKYSAKVSPEHRVVAIDPHNILVSTALRLGIVGLILFFYIIFAFAKMSWITIKHGKDDFIKSWGICITAAFVGWFVKGMFEPALSHIPAIVLYTIFAMMTILWKLDSEHGSPVLLNQ